MRIRYVIILCFLILYITAGAEKTLAEDRSFTIDQVEIDAQINEDGSIFVQELFTYTFDGAFNGMSRSIHSDVQNFQAFLIEGDEIEDRKIDDLQPLNTEKEDQTYNVFTSSENETKSVLYQYEVDGSVKKYIDIADLQYSFFDESNETDLQNVHITIQTPAGTTEDTHAFLREDGTGELHTSEDMIQYSNPSLKENEDSRIRIIFPATQLNESVGLEKEEELKDSIITSEQEWAARAASFDEKMAATVPFLWGLVGLVILIGIYLLLTHPARYRGDKSEDALLRLVEETDPLYLKYLHDHYVDFKGYLVDHSIIAALFSLKRRGIVTLEEVPSERNENKMTYRFRWVNSNKESIDEADHYLYEWLFTEEDEQGVNFLLESLMAQETDSDSMKEEKATKFTKQLRVWSELVKKRDGYVGIREAFKHHKWISRMFVLLSFGMFYYFTTVDPISEMSQLVLPIIVGSFAIIGILFSRYKWVPIAYFPVVMFISLLGLTISGANWLFILFNGLAFLLLMCTPAYYYRKEVKRLKYAINVAKAMYHRKQYPTDSDPEKLEKRLENALILGQGERYGEQIGKEHLVEKVVARYPLLQNYPVATETFSYTNLALYTTVISNSTSNSSSNSSPTSTGGGGAGAF